MSMPGAVLDTYRGRADGSTVRFPTPGALAKHVDRRIRQTGPLNLIDQIAVDLLNDEIDKAEIDAPPQIGKSDRVSHWTPLWWLKRDPSLRIGIASAEQDLAVRWGRQIKRDIDEHPDLDIQLRADSRAAGRWETMQGGGLYCVGIGGTLTGRPIDLLVIDDPIKDRAQAESKVFRERLWDWYENVAAVRAQKIVLMNTRWHADDLSGRLALREPGEWRVLSMPAICENQDTDPLGRLEGEEIESARPELHKPGWFTHRRSVVSPYVWRSLYQQSPTAAQGNIFKRGDWRYWESIGGGERGDRVRLDDALFDIADCFRFITMDLATSTKTSADWTVAAAWAITLSGDLLLLDRVRERVPDTDHAALLEPLRSRWLGPFDVTYVESRMFGTTLVYALGRKGVPVAELEADVDKLTRALPAADLTKQHRVWLPKTAPWLDEWLDEHAEFNKGAHDDQVDVMAYAARVAHTRWLPAESAEDERRRTASNPSELDFMKVPY